MQNDVLTFLLIGLLLLGSGLFSAAEISLLSLGGTGRGGCRAAARGR